MQDESVSPASQPEETAGNAADNQTATQTPAVDATNPAVPTEVVAETPPASESATETEKVADPAATPTYKVGREVFDDAGKLAEFSNKMYGNFGNIVDALKRMNPNLTDRDIDMIKTTGQTAVVPEIANNVPSTGVSAPAREALKTIGYEDDGQVTAIAKAIDIIARDQGYVKNSDPWVNPDTRNEYEQATKFFQANPDAVPLANAIGVIMDTAKANGRSLTIEEAHKAIQSTLNPSQMPTPVESPGVPRAAIGNSGANAQAAPAPTKTEGQVSAGVAEMINLH